MAREKNIYILINEIEAWVSPETQAQSKEMLLCPRLCSRRW